MLEDDWTTEKEDEVADTHKHRFLELKLEFVANQGSVANAVDDLHNRLAFFGLHLVPIFADHGPQLSTTPHCRFFKFPGLLKTFQKRMIRKILF